VPDRPCHLMMSVQEGHSRDWLVIYLGGGASDDWWRKGLHSRTEADSSRYKDHLQPTKLKQSKIATEELVKRYPSMEDYTTRELGYEMELIYLSGRLISYMSLICRCFLVCRFFEHFKVNF
jgi:hypothetical protein